MQNVLFYVVRYPHVPLYHILRSSLIHEKSVFETTVCLMVFYQRFMALFTYGNMDY